MICFLFPPPELQPLAAAAGPPAQPPLMAAPAVAAAVAPRLVDLTDATAWAERPPIYLRTLLSGLPGFGREVSWAAVPFMDVALVLSSISSTTSYDRAEAARATGAEIASYLNRAEARVTLAIIPRGVGMGLSA